MPLAFNGEFVVQRTIEEVYDFMTDPYRLGPILPYFQGLAVTDERNFEVKVKVGISHIRGLADVKLNVAEAERPHRLRYQGKGSLAGGSVDFTASFDLEANAEGTRAVWKGEAQVFGILTSVAGGLLRPLAQKNAEKAIGGLQAALAAAGLMPVEAPVAASEPSPAEPSGAPAAQIGIVDPLVPSS